MTMLKNKKHFLLFIILIISISFLFLSKSFKRPYDINIPQEIPNLHTYASKIDKALDDTSAMDVSDNGGGASITCSSTAKVHKKTDTIDFYYKNPSRSLASVVLQLKVGEDVIALSGAIPPGYQSEYLDLNTNIYLSQGEYKGSLIISFYDLTTGSKLMVDTKVGINISVGN